MLHCKHGEREAGASFGKESRARERELAVAAVCALPPSLLDLIDGRVDGHKRVLILAKLYTGNKRENNGTTASRRSSSSPSSTAAPPLIDWRTYFLSPSIAKSRSLLSESASELGELYPSAVPSSESVEGT
jgi:hypothetical protein